MNVQQAKHETRKRRLIRSGIPAHLFSPAREYLMGVVIHAQDFEVSGNVEATFPFTPEVPEETRRSRPFRIELLNADGKTWSLPTNADNFTADTASALLDQAKRLAGSPNRPGVRIMKEGGTRAVHCFNFKKRG